MNLRYYEERLLEERRSVLRQIERSTDALLNTTQSAGGDGRSFAFHMADLGTDAMEREKAFLFASQDGRALWEIDEALRCLYHTPETFGLCMHCGERISAARLDVLPSARFCLACKQHDERRQ